MSRLVTNELDLARELGSDQGMFVLFYSSWCFFSAMFLPVFESYAERSPGNFCRVDLEYMPGAAEEYAIEVTPTIIFFKNGKTERRLDGEPEIGLDENKLVKFIHSVSVPVKT